MPCKSVPVGSVQQHTCQWAVPIGLVKDELEANSLQEFQAAGHIHQLVLHLLIA